MGAILAPTVLHAKTLRASQQIVAFGLGKQLSDWEAEINFYHRLLTWSLLSCRESDRPAIETFLTQVTRLRNVDLPALKTQFGFVQTALEPTLNARIQPERVALRTRFNHFDQKLQALKLRIFGGLSYFGRVEIW